MKVDYELDLTGMPCPMPLIKLRKAVTTLEKSQIICIIGDDPIIESSMQDFCEENGYEVVEISREGRKVTMIIKI